MTDALANIPVQAWSLPENTINILNQLYRILTSCRGGNETLSTMLRTKITQIQDKETFFLQPSSRIEEVLELDHVRIDTDTDTNAEDESFFNISSLMESREIDDNITGFGGDVSDPEINCGRRTQLASPCNIFDTDLPRTLANNNWNFYEQLQIFDESFNDFQAFENA